MVVTTLVAVVAVFGAVAVFNSITAFRAITALGTLVATVVAAMSATAATGAAMFRARIQLFADVAHVVAVAWAIVVAVSLGLVDVADGCFTGAEAPVHADGSTRHRPDVVVDGGRRALDCEIGALHAVAGLDHDGNAETALDFGDERALVVQNVESHRRAGRDRKRGRLLHQVVFDRAQYGEGNRLRRADIAGALAMRAL